MFSDNPEHDGWRTQFLEFSENDEKITPSQVKRMKEIHIFTNSIISETGRCLKSNLKDCFKAKNKENENDFLTWTEFVHWINSLGK